MRETVASYHDREKWLEERKKGLGGSDAAAILGLNPYRTARDVWADKMGLTGEVEITPAMQRGIVLEPVASDLYVEETGRSVRRQPLKRHPDYDFILGNVDRQVLAGTADVTSTGVLEIKCPGLRVMSSIKAHGLPDRMTVQLMHYLAVYGYEWGSFALFNAENWDIIYFDLEADQDLIDTIVEREVEFWQRYVETGQEPPIEGDDKPIEVPEVEGEVTTVDNEQWRRLAKDYAEAKELKSAATDMEKELKDQIKELMHREELHAAEVPGVARFYYKPYPGRTSWKKTAEAIAQEAKVQVEPFVVKGDPYTRFVAYLFD